MDGGWKNIWSSGIEEHRYEVDISFAVANDGTFTGTGKGWDEWTDSICNGYGRGDVTFSFSGYLGYMERMVFTEYSISPQSYLVNYSGCSFDKDPKTISTPRYVDNVNNIQVEDGAVYESGNPATYGDMSEGIRYYDRLIINGSDIFDFRMSVGSDVIDVMQGEQADWELTVTRTIGTPQEITLDVFFIFSDGAREQGTSTTIVPADTHQFPSFISITCDDPPGPLIVRQEARTPQGELRTAEFTLNILANPDCPSDPDSGNDATDTDGDGIIDGSDQCPLNAEVLNGVSDEDGCPEMVNVLITGPILSGDGMLTLNTKDPDGWHTRWETGENGAVEYEKCNLSEEHRWCVTQHLDQNSVFQAKQCTQGSNGAYGYCAIPGDQRTTSTDVWLITGQMHVASDVQLVQPITSTGGYSVDTGVVISYGEFTVALKGTEVIAQVDAGGMSTLTVLEGEAYIWQTAKPDEIVRVSAGQQLETRPDEFLPGPTSAESFIESIEPLKTRDPTLLFLTGDTATPDVNLSEEQLVFYGAIAIIIFLIIIAAIIIGIYFGVKKIRNRKKRGSIEKGT